MIQRGCARQRQLLNGAGTLTYGSQEPGCPTAPEQLQEAD